MQQYGSYTRIALRIAVIALASNKIWGQPEVTKAPKEALSAIETGNAIEVSINGKLFTTYKTGPDQKYPYFWPINGPLTGQTLTTESSEPYPHHHSLFFACDRVNDGNYWQDTNQKGQIVSQGPALLESTADRVVIADHCEWRIPGQNPVIRDGRRITVSAPAENLRYIDFDISLEALEDVTIEKTNHSLFAARVVPELAVTAGGTLVNAEGQRSEAGTFGRESTWASYSGTRDGKTEGIAILQHPGNPWFPSKWFTRDYGFFSPTPMYWLENDRFNWSKGRMLRFRYRVVIHPGNSNDAQIAGLYAAYSKSE